MIKTTKILWAIGLSLTTTLPAIASSKSDETLVDLSPRYVRQAPNLSLSDLEPVNLIQQESILTLNDKKWILSWVGQ